MRDSNHLIGTIVDGRYRILRRLGSGGMGEVYLAEHLQLHRKEALKVLKSRFAKDPGHLARFRREARATNRVQHPNIVGFYDFGKLPDGRLYLSMEFADGPNLKKVLEAEGRFDVPRAVSIIKQLALAIHYAHRKDVIHRDLKPQNLVVVQKIGYPDMLKVLDFGVAKITAPGYMENFSITKEGQLFGTPAYIAPEQIRGIRDDFRSDIYALGCIAYELVTGQTPFSGRSMSVLQAHISEEPIRPSDCCIEANIPRALDEIILNCLIKAPEERIQSGAVVAEVLSALRFDSVPTQSLTTRRHKEGTQSGFDQETTTRGVPEYVASLDDQDTNNVFVTHAEYRLHYILRDLAESLCDLGCSEPMLLVVLAEVNQVEQEIEALGEELQELARSDLAIAQKSREQSASLRFSMGELRFSHVSGQEESLEQAMAALDNRLSDLLEHTRIQHATVTERQIDKTAERACKAEELQALDHQLHQLIKLYADEMRGSQRVTSLLEELEEVSISL